jgi:hypothetical protein
MKCLYRNELERPGLEEECPVLSQVPGTFIFVATSHIICGNFFGVPWRTPS